MTRPSETFLSTDVAVIGGGLGGVAAALAAARWGKRVVLTEETDWIGGQLTSQAVPPDEHPWLEHYGTTRLYRDLRRRVRDYYRRNYPLTPDALRDEYLNPGNGFVSGLCHEPRVGLAALYELLAPWLGNGQIVLKLNHRPVEAEVDGDRVKALRLLDRDTGGHLVVEAPWFLDATELGDLLPMTGTEFVTGSESRKDTGELHAGETASPDNQQAFTCCFAMEYRKGGDHTIDKPEEYDFWRAYAPQLDPPWPGPLFSWTQSDVRSLKPVHYRFDPENETLGAGQGGWLYRRIADRSKFAPGFYPGDITLVNWATNDYLLGPLVGVPEAEAAEHVRRAKQQSLSLLYWLQTESPRPDGKQGWPGLRLRPDIMGTADGLAKYPYIRESRRVRAEFTVTEAHVGTEQRAPLTHAETFADTVGVGLYRIDLHPSSGGDNYIDVGCLPFQIPLGALIPVRMENLLPACKNIGTTHITNGCYRLHPVEWGIGEAAGALVAWCAERGHAPRQVRNTPALLAEFQAGLEHENVDLTWDRWQAKGI